MKSISESARGWNRRQVVLTVAACPDRSAPSAVCLCPTNVIWSMPYTKVPLRLTRPSGEREKRIRVTGPESPSSKPMHCWHPQRMLVYRETIVGVLMYTLLHDATQKCDRIVKTYRIITPPAHSPFDSAFAADGGSRRSNTRPDTRF